MGSDSISSNLTDINNFVPDKNEVAEQPEVILLIFQKNI